MSKPLVSVLMPAYNHALFVRFAVECVLGQSYANLELIVIDDASQDGTWIELQSFKDDRLHLYRHETNRGAHASLNEALGIARGEFMVILNSDDLFSHGRIERLMVEAFNGDRRNLFVITDVEFIDREGNAAPEHPRAMAYRALCDFCDTQRPENWFLAGNVAISTSNFFFSRPLAEKVGKFAPLRYTHDWDWALRAIRYASPIWVREELLKYRVHEANTLSENDVWRHIHENSYVQARALMALDRSLGDGVDRELKALDICVSLLKNESCHPLSLLCLLTYVLAGVEDKRLLELAWASREGGVLQTLSELSACPPDLFRSIPYLAEREKVAAAQATMIDERWRAMQKMSEEIAKRDETIAAQSALIDERWQAMQKMSGEIASRDECIASQAAMIEERWNIIQHMNGEIANRDQLIEGLQDEFSTLYANPIVRLVMHIKKRLRK